MKKFLFVLAACCLLSGVQSQSHSLNPGDVILNVNIGTPHLFKFFAKAAVKSEAFKKSFDGQIEVSKIRGWNPVAIKGEYGVSEIFAIGLNYSFWTLRFDVMDYYNLQNQNYGTYLKDSVDTYKVNLTSTSFGIRPVLHLPFESYKNDVYFGLGLGITKNKISIAFESTDAGRLASKVRKDIVLDLSLPGGVYFAPSVGYRHYMNPFFGLNFELGYEKGAILQAGLVFKFNLNEATRKKQKEENK
jgi:hypothetical protein